MKKSVKSKKKSNRGMSGPAKALLLVLCAVFLGVFAFSGYKLFTIVHGYKSSERQYNSLTERYVAPVPSASPTPAPVDAAAPTAEPVNLNKSPIQVDFAQLKAECADIVGWIYSEGTPINYPIVRCAYDNPAIADYYYLYRDIHGDYSANGTPFLDVNCSPDFNNYNSIVYGHHMKDGSMFASLDNYRSTDPTFLNEHPCMYLNTPTQDYRIELFAGYVTDADSNTYTLFFPDDASFLLYCQEMKDRSDFKTDVELSPGDRIITLSTCSYEWHDARYVVQGKLVPLE